VDVTFWAPFLNAVVEEVGDEHCAVLGDIDGNGVLVLPGVGSGAAKAGQKCAVGLELLDAIIVKVGHEDVAVRSNDDAGRYGEPAVQSVPLWAAVALGKRLASSRCRHRHSRTRHMATRVTTLRS
jgi:hypothetical protein